MLKAGLTGGIATGKSSALATFVRLGAVGIDADRLGHRVIEKGRPAYLEAVREFGSRMILAADGEIDRKKLGAIVFADEAKLKRLNAIVHPRVFEEPQLETDAALAARSHPIVMVDASLMIETGSYRRYDKIVVVFCAPEIQLSRLMARDHLTSEEAIQRISRQLPSEEKLKYAHYRIETSGTLEDTRRQVREVYGRLLGDYEEMQGDPG